MAAKPSWTPAHRDFMLVGNGNAFDDVDVKPRLACKLGQLPALDVSPQAGLAGLQVQASSNSPTHYITGGMQLLLDAYPTARARHRHRQQQRRRARRQGRYAQQAYNSLGIKVTTVQEKPRWSPTSGPTWSSYASPAPRPTRKSPPRTRAGSHRDARHRLAARLHLVGRAVLRPEVGRRRQIGVISAVVRAPVQPALRTDRADIPSCSRSAASCRLR